MLHLAGCLSVNTRVTRRGEGATGMTRKAMAMHRQLGAQNYGRQEQFAANPLLPIFNQLTHEVSGLRPVCVNTRSRPIVV